MESKRATGLWIVALGALGSLIGACSSGGGGGSKPLTIGFDVSSSTTTEGSTATVTLVLSSTKGPLSEAATITVQDRGGGTSVNGADHDFTADQVVTFPVGADDGATQTVNVAATADLSIEGSDETLRLTLLRGSRPRETVLRPAGSEYRESCWRRWRRFP